MPHRCRAKNARPIFGHVKHYVKMTLNIPPPLLTNQPCACTIATHISYPVLAGQCLRGEGAHLYLFAVYVHLNR